MLFLCWYVHSIRVHTSSCSNKSCWGAHRFRIQCWLCTGLLYWMVTLPGVCWTGCTLDTLCFMAAGGGISRSWWRLCRIRRLPSVWMWYERSVFQAITLPAKQIFLSFFTTRIVSPSRRQFLGVFDHHWFSWFAPPATFALHMWLVPLDCSGLALL